MPDLVILFMLFFAGILAGLSNAIAGGGTFFTFPVFLATGIPPVVANASNAIAVWPGHAMALIEYRGEIKQQLHGQKLTLLLVLVGGISGAYLLASIDNSSFMRLVPFLVFFATCLFAYGKTVLIMLGSKLPLSAVLTPYLKRLSEFVFAVYGGFFGAGYGVMLMAWLNMTNDNDVKTNNLLKNLIASVVTSVAIILFVLSGMISWVHTIVAFIGAAIGGYLGGRVARQLSALGLRRIIISFGLFLSVYYLLKYYA